MACPGCVASLLLFLLLATFVATSAQGCSAPYETVFCSADETTRSTVQLLQYQNAQRCDALLESDLCVDPSQEFYQFDLTATLDLTATSTCTATFLVDSVPLSGTPACATDFCNGTTSSNCGFISQGGLTVQFLVTNVRYVKSLENVGSFSYDYIELTQMQQYTDLANPAGASSALECITACSAPNITANCTFRPSDINGTYCYQDNAGNFSASFGPSSFNCVSVQQSVFVPHTPDLTRSCCGQCESCACALGPTANASTSVYVPYFPQSSPYEVYSLYNSSSGVGFQVDATTGGLPNATYNTTNPLFVAAYGWPLLPTASDANYYAALNACPIGPPCNYGGGLWLAPLRRDPLTAEGYASDVDGKLACGYCSQGMPGVSACGDPAIPALTALQTYVMGMSPICTLWSTSDDATLRFDLAVMVSGLNGQTHTETFLDLSLENQQILVVSGDASVYVSIELNIQQSPLEDPLMTDSYFATCAPDAAGNDLTPLDPLLWSGHISPWANRTGAASGLDNCYGCMPDEQSRVPGQPRLWWYMNATQALEFINLGNIGQALKSGLTNHVVAEDDCDNPAGNQTGCAAGTAPGVQTATCALGGMHALLPSVTAASIGRAFAAYRQLLGLATTKAIDPLSSPAGAYLPPFWNYQTPNVWLEPNGDLMDLVYTTPTSPFENAVLQEFDVMLMVESSLAAVPEATPPVVWNPDASAIYPCVLSNTNPPRFLSSYVSLQISPAVSPPAFPITYTVSATADTVVCLVGGQEFYPVSLQNAAVVIEITCNASALEFPVNAAGFFTLTVTRGSIVSLLYQTMICPVVAKVIADPNQELPPPPVGPVTMLNQTAYSVLGQNTGPGSAYATANELWKPQRTNTYVYGLVAAGAMVFVGIVVIGIGVYVAIAEQVSHRRSLKED